MFVQTKTFDTSLRVGKRYPSTSDSQAESLNNCIAPSIDRDRSKPIEECRDVDNNERRNRRDDVALDVEIWMPSNFVRTRSYTTRNLLGIVGNGCKAFSAFRSRPCTAPPAVKKLPLKPRPPLEKYRTLVEIPPPKLRSKPATPNPKVRRSSQDKEKTHMQSHIAEPSKPITVSVQRSNSVSVPPSTLVSAKGESSKQGDLRRRKAIAKSNAEKEFLRLLPEGAIRLKYPPYIQPSPVDGLPGTVCFNGTPTEKSERGLIPYTARKVRVHFSGLAGSPVRLAFLKAGFQVTTSPTKWNVLWGPIPKAVSYEKMTKSSYTVIQISKWCLRYQRVNHFPGSGELGRKDKLHRNFKSMQRQDPKTFDFMPTCFLLPEDRVELKIDLAQHKGRRYIIKPVASSCGRGIRITSNPSIFTCAKECIVQRYIQKPMTIDGYKFDLRIYVGVTSYDPLRVYIYEDGLVRFATKSYTRGKGEMDNRYVHITNTSVNRHNDCYVRGNVDGTDGSKWSLKAFRDYVTRHHLIEWSHLWKQIHDIVRKTFLCVEEKMLDHYRRHRLPSRDACFEILGFDILLDARRRAWLLEVNTFPDLSGSSPLDRHLKTQLIEDMLHMVGVVTGRSTVKSVPEMQRRGELARCGRWETAALGNDDSSRKLYEY